MTRQNKILAGTFLWGASNLFAYHVLKHHTLKNISELHTQIDDLLEVSAALARDMSYEQLDAALEDAPYSPEFFARLNNQ